MGWAIAGAILAVLAGAALAHKWELGLRRSVVARVVLGAIGVALVALTGIDGVLAGLVAGAVALGGAAAIVLWRFYRDPEREAPDREDVVLSPADGLVVYVHRSSAGELPVATKEGRNYRLDELTRTGLASDEAVVVGIALSFLDVHVNRSPIAGEVRFTQRFPGPFASLKDPSAVFLNERSTTIVERPGLEIAIVLIASRLVRRIVSYVKPGESVDLGQRIGVIRFGSQVDLVLPARDDLRVLVEPGQRVTAGRTILAELDT